MRVARGERYAGRALLIGLMAITILPFMSIFTTALHPSGSVPSGLSLAGRTAMGQLRGGLPGGQHGALLASSVFIVLGRRPRSLVISTMAGFAIGLLRIPGADCCCSSSSSG